MKFLKKATFVLILIFSVVSLFGKNQNDTTYQNSNFINSPPDSTDKPNNATSVLENVTNNRQFELILSSIIVGFGIFVIFTEAYLASKKVIKSEYAFKCIIITLVIIGSLVLITAGYSNYQINGITGLLGSIAGYLLAKNESITKERDEHDKDEK